MTTKTVAPQMEKDTDRYLQFDDFASDYQSQSEAVRAAIRDGLDNDSAGIDSTLMRSAFANFSLAVGALALDASMPAAVGAATAAALFIAIELRRII